MSELQVYRRGGEDLFVLPNGDDPTEPGQFVGHAAWPTSTIGTVVAINETEVSVLWSKEPPSYWPESMFTGSIDRFNPEQLWIAQSGSIVAPYVLFQVTPTIFSSCSFVSVGTPYRTNAIMNQDCRTISLTSGSL